MSKPTETPRWADSGGDIVEPVEGKKDIGFLPEEKPPAQHHNWLFNLIWQWLDWLDDLVSADDGTDVAFGTRDSFDFGNIQLANDDTIAGPGMIHIDGSALGVGEHAILISGANADLRLEDNGAIFCGDIGCADVDASSLMTGEADTKHADRMVLIGAAGGMPGTPGGSGLSVAAGDVSSYWTDTDSGHTIYFTLPVPKGSRLKEVRAYIRDSGSTVTMKVWKVLATDGTQAQLGSTQTSAASSTDQNLNVTGLTDAAGDDSFYNVAVTMGGSLQRVYGVRYTFDRI